MKASEGSRAERQLLRDGVKPTSSRHRLTVRSSIGLDAGNRRNRNRKAVCEVPRRIRGSAREPGTARGGTVRLVGEALGSFCWRLLRRQGDVGVGEAVRIVRRNRGYRPQVNGGQPSVWLRGRCIYPVFLRRARTPARLSTSGGRPELRRGWTAAVQPNCWVSFRSVVLP